MAYLKRLTGLILVIFVLLSAHGSLSGNSKVFAVRPASQNKKIEHSALSRLKKLGIRLRPGFEYRTDSKPTNSSTGRCASIVYQTLLSIPEDHRSQLKNLTLFYTYDGRRGLSGNGAVVLRCLNVTDEELSSVLMHEIGHLVDGSLLTGTQTSSPSSFYDFGVPVMSNDTSVQFYSISWETELLRKKGSKILGFVSLYAMTDPFEDFAETYTYFRYHGVEFRKLLKTSEALRKKYEFMKNVVFGGQEFGIDGIKKISVNYWQRPYDVTVIPITS